MDFEEFKSDWLDPDAYKMLFSDLANIDWTQDNLITASMIAVLLSMFGAIFWASRHRPDAKWGWLVILTPVLFMFSAGVVQADNKPEEFVLMVVLVVIAQVLIALRMRSMYAPNNGSFNG